MNLIDKAKEFAIVRHSGQVDDYGIDYYKAHLYQVYKILKEVTTDIDILCAGLLHDTLEDTSTTLQELETEFNLEVAQLVYEVTHEGTKDSKGYYFPRLKTKEGILIKFADRLSNLSRMECWDSKRQEQYLRKSKFWNDK